MGEVEKILERLAKDVAEGLPEANYRADEDHDMHRYVQWWWDGDCVAEVCVDVDARVWIEMPGESRLVNRGVGDPREAIYSFMRMLLCAVDELEKRREKDV